MTGSRGCSAILCMGMGEKKFARILEGWKATILTIGLQALEMRPPGIEPGSIAGDLLAPGWEPIVYHAQGDFSAPFGWMDADAAADARDEHTRTRLRPCHTRAHSSGDEWTERHTTGSKVPPTAPPASLPPSPPMPGGASTPRGEVHRATPGQHARAG